MKGPRFKVQEPKDERTKDQREPTTAYLGDGLDDVELLQRLDGSRDNDASGGHALAGGGVALVLGGGGGGQHAATDVAGIADGGAGGSGPTETDLGDSTWPRGIACFVDAALTFGTRTRIIEFANFE